MSRTVSPNTAGGAVPDWLRLQKKIFTRWCNQKTQKRGIEIKDCVTGFSDGVHLIQLLEILSETTFQGKMIPSPKLEIQKIENINLALEFAWKCGIKMKIKPSAEMIAKNDDKSMLSLVFAIMLKYLKFEDEEDEASGALSAKDILLLWAQNQTKSYPGVAVDGFGKCFHDGLAICALLHKALPKTVPFTSLTKDNKIKNIELALDVADKYFGLEKYLEPSDIPKLDENSMFVFVSDIYYAIAEQRKITLAAIRIGKVIKLTEQNDAMKKEYNETAAKWKALATSAQTLLEDRVIENTMAGAQRRLNDFYNYKRGNKNKIMEMNLDLEALYANLAVILRHNKRPEFVPADGLTVSHISSTVSRLEKLENEQNVNLHAEVNRQVKLLKLDARHKDLFDTLYAWIRDKDAYLSTKEKVESVSEAQLHLRLLVAYEHENKSVVAAKMPPLKALSSETRENKYESQSAIEKREADIDAGLSKLNTLRDAKKPILDDHLAREIFKEKVLSMNARHVDGHGKFDEWAKLKEAYLNTKENITCVREANEALSILESFVSEMSSQKDTVVDTLAKLGAEILASKYSSKYSSYSFHAPGDVTGRGKKADDRLASLAKLAASKKKVLEDDLAREIEKERLRLEFAFLAAAFVRWTKDTVEEIGKTHFGFSLKEVEAYKSVLGRSDGDLKKFADDSRKAFTDVDSKMKALGVKENEYTKLTLDSLAKTRQDLDSAIGKRQAAYEETLAHERKLDALRRKFADAAESFHKWIVGSKASITGSNRASILDIEGVLKSCNKLKSTATDDQDGKPLAAIRSIAQEMEKEKITNNEYTNLTALDLEVLWKQYQSWLQKKQAMLEQEFDRIRLRGVTKEQLAEIESNFQQFDNDKSGNISKKELKACLYSLGEERSKTEVDEILKSYGNGKIIQYERFKEFMIKLFGSSIEKDDILNAFILINKVNVAAKQPLITKKARMDVVMNDYDIAYFCRTAPKAGAEYDFGLWTNDIFAR